MMKALILTIALTLIATPSLFAQDLSANADRGDDSLCKYAPRLAAFLGAKCQPPTMPPVPEPSDDTKPADDDGTEIKPSDDDGTDDTKIDPPTWTRRG